MQKICLPADFSFYELYFCIPQKDFNCLMIIAALVKMEMPGYYVFYEREGGKERWEGTILPRSRLFNLACCVREKWPWLDSGLCAVLLYPREKESVCVGWVGPFTHHVEYSNLKLDSF